MMNHTTLRQWKTPFILSLLLIIILGATIAIKESIGVPDDNFCLEDIPTHTVILMDSTTQIRPHAMQSVNHHILEEKKSLHAEERLSLYALSPEGDSAILPLFSMCRPGDETTINPLIDNRSIARQRIQRFEEELRAVLRDLKSYQDANTSPITQGIYELVTTEKITKLVLFSDLAEHTSAFSIPFQVGNIETYKQSLYFRGLKGRLRDVKVLVVQFTAKRFSHREKRIAQLWTALWKHSEAKDLEVVTLPEAH